MAKQIKIVRVEMYSFDRAESELTALINQGWVIVTSGGAGDGENRIFWGFVVLQKD